MSDDKVTTVVNPVQHPASAAHEIIVALIKTGQLPSTNVVNKKAEHIIEIHKAITAYYKTLGK